MELAALLVAVSCLGLVGILWRDSYNLSSLVARQNKTLDDAVMALAERGGMLAATSGYKQEWSSEVQKVIYVKKEEQ